MRSDTETEQEKCPKESDTELKKKGIIAQHSGPVSVIKWKWQTNVTMILMYHRDELLCIQDYNQYMGGVNLTRFS
jgi:hypothetical protein